MKIRTAIAVLILLAFAVAATAATVRVSESNYAALGWTKTLKTGAETGQAVTFMARTDTVPAGVQGVQCSPKKSTTAGLSWAGLGMDAFQGRMVSSITVFKLRTNGFEGDGTAWEPPSVYLGLSKDGTNQRSLRYLPYASTSRGTSWNYYEYDLMSPTSKWYSKIDGTIKTGWAGVLGVSATLQFDNTVTTPLPGGNSFNVFNGCSQNGEIAYGSSARGMVDWVEIGFAGEESTIYDFVVPEPGSLLALATGLIGFIGLRKRF